MRRRAGRRLALLAGVVLCGYFAFHLTFGARGYVRLSAAQAELARAEIALAEAQAQHKTWEARAAPLRAATLDPDAVEARARAVLGWRREGEAVILLQD